MHLPDLDGAVLGAGDLRGPVERLVDRVALEEVVAAQSLLHLGIRTVGDQRLAVANANRRRRRGRRELVAAEHDACFARLLREREVTLDQRPARLVGERLPAGLVGVDQCQVLHASPFRTSIAP